MWPFPCLHFSAAFHIWRICCPAMVIQPVPKRMRADFMFFVERRRECALLGRHRLSILNARVNVPYSNKDAKVGRDTGIYRGLRHKEFKNNEQCILSFPQQELILGNNRCWDIKGEGCSQIISRWNFSCKKNCGALQQRPRWLCHISVCSIPSGAYSGRRFPPH